MKRISQIFLSGGVTLILLAAACAPVEGVPNIPGALQDNLTVSPNTPATTDPSQATATNTTSTPSIPVTGLEVMLLNCPYCVDNVVHDQLLIPRDATFRVTSPPELVRDDDDGDGDGGHRRTAQLSGAEEVPGPGDPDGSGTAMVRLSLEEGEVCFDLSVSNIGPATAAHIHEGAEGVAGEVVVPLDPAPTEGSSSGCISDVDNALIQNIIENPEQYYVNVHNEEFPDGAIRGQLGRVDGDDDDDDDDNDDRMGCRVIDRFRDKKLVLCRAEENTTITMNVCMDDNNCTEVQLTLQGCALTATPSPVVTATQTVTATGTAATFTPVSSTATVTSAPPTSTATSTPIAPATGTATATSVTDTPAVSATPTATATATSTPTP